MTDNIISVYYDMSDPYRIYGIEHFVQKYGIRLSFNTESKINIIYGNTPNDIKGFNIYIKENEIGNGILRYLKVDGEKVPLFEKPIRLDGNNKPLVMYVDNKENEHPCVVLGDNSITVSFDIFNEVGHILTGYFEHFWEMKENKHEQLSRIPVVDYYEKILFDCLLLAPCKLNIPLKCKPFWPNGKKFAVCLTHDVDRVRKTYQYLTHFVKYLKRRDFSMAIVQITSIFRKLRGNEPYWNFEKIMEIERKLGVKSTFFFLNEQRKFFCSPCDWKLYWGRYDIKDAKIVETIKRLDAEGWEIGIHGSYNSYSDQKRLEEEKNVLEEILGKKVYGISQHYCNLENPKTWEYHEKVGLAYDSTIGFVGEIGFKYGTCFPFHPFNPKEVKSLLLWELPIIIMDNACSSEKRGVWEECINALNSVEKYNGILLLRWHQSIFNEHEFPGRSSIYEKIIEIGKERNAWITNAYNVVEWLTMREENKLHYGEAFI